MRRSLTNLLTRRWTFVVAVVVVALAVFTVTRLHGIFGSEDPTTRPSADALENTGFNPKRVLLEVYGDPGATATINFLDPAAQPQQVKNATLPWSTTLVTDDPTLYADLRAQGDAQPISCRITVNGVVKDERTSTNVDAYISCLDKSA